ncbi:hypothetical protein [Flavobacterium sp. LC2016-12]|uniref:hypothetical protein n=1 Tax=Flavobacterium sp. LC2016-12 TaxID=2783794 RepID=UPI00188B7387|nr:hypothetical protein [Flavobacterium sp. LC2016-12]MBF4465636.1 hypothetical protein [Flavobacterium sp. LC2016-12]
MNHTVKTRIFKALSLLPDRLGYSLYHILQDIGSKTTLEDKINSTKRTYDTIKRILLENNLTTEGLNIAEIGSGWVPVFPYQLILFGKAKSVDTYDINEHYNIKEIKKLNEYYNSQFNFEIENRDKYPLHNAVKYFPKTNICNGDLKNVDLVLSRFVLEHISPENLSEIHDFLFSDLKSGSYVLHLISPSDHRAYSDSSLSLQDFLKYSEEEWNQIQTKFDYHNRLRFPQYLELFKKDFEIIFFEHDQINYKSESFKKFKKLKIHNDFAKFTEQELMAGSVNVLFKKK